MARKQRGRGNADSDEPGPLPEAGGQSDRSTGPKPASKPGARQRKKAASGAPEADKLAVGHEADQQPPFPIVGIGASAGGLAALKELFDEMPADTGAAFVVVVHLSPEHESRLAELLQPHCNLRVQQVTKTVAIEPDQVYVIPPNANLNTIDTHLRLSELEEQRRERAPIDHFFRTLAKTHDGQSVGIILTGTGSDGTLGLRRIKEQGGLTIAQDPDEAEQDGMPRSAIASGMVDLVCRLREIPPEIAHFARTQPYLRVPEEGVALEQDESRILQKICGQIRARTGQDFTQYKRSTVLRRIQRRMQLRHVERLEAYLDLLREDREEVQQLFNDLLITVTEFFRDRHIFDRLEQSVVPSLFTDKTSDDRIRVWSVGCSTGEEAYSLAMLLLEEAGRHEIHPQLQVFASDLHEEAVHRAREGVYPEEIATTVSPERLRRFFQSDNGHYRVRREVREIVTFAAHNLLRDPPFSHLDLIVCRNLLIYLQRDVQQDVISLFHYALEPEGLLLLGTSETVDRTDLFHCDDREVCLYRRRNVPAREPRLPVFPLTTSGRPSSESADESGRPQHRHPGFGSIHEQMVERYAPPSVLVNDQHDVVHTSASAGRYLQVPGGEPTSSLFRLAREPLRIELRSVLHSARESGRAVRSKPISLTLDGELRRVVVHARPPTEADLSGFVLIVFDELPELSAEGAAAGDGGHGDATVQELEAELELNRQRLQAAIEEYETSREEMQASNEELQSANEELRSTMEELETSKEELQSMNEELTTVNQENRHRVEELGQLSADLQNLLTATDIATIFLDRELRIVRFTRQVGELWNVRHTDRGRPLSDITHHLGYDELPKDARRVLDRLVPVEREIEDENNHWYLTRILPYRATYDRIDGVVITLVDITDRKQAEHALRQSEDQYRTLVEQVTDFAIFRTDTEGRAVTWNEGVRRVLGFSADEFLGCDITHSIFLPEDIAAGVPEKELETARREGTAGNDRWMRRHNGETFFARGTTTAITDAEGNLLGFTKVMRDHTGLLLSEQALRRSEEQYRRLFESIDEGFCIFEMLFDEQERPVDYRFLEVNPAFERHTGMQNAAGRTMREIVPQHEQHWFDLYGQVALTGESIRFQNRAAALGRFFEVFAFRCGEPEERKVAALFSDVTERKEMEHALMEASRHKDEFLAMLGHELRNPLAAIVSGSEALGLIDLPDEASDVHAVISRQATHMTCLVDDLLDVSRIARGRLSVRQEPVELRKIVQEAIADYCSCHPLNGCTLDCRLPEEDVWVSGDATRLSQAITNVLHNSVKFSDGPNAISVAVELVSSPADSSAKSMARIEITDRGVGMTAETLRDIFNPFAQAETTINRSRGGLGLGLALVKGLVELHGGSVNADSEGPGQGSILRLTLPLGHPPEQLPGQPEADSITPQRILLIDDRRDASMPVQRLLEIEGHEVRVASTATGGLELARQFHPETVLCDIGLEAELSGYDVARALRAEEEFRRTYLVALTGYGREDDLREARAAGFDWHMTKPAGIDALREILCRRPRFTD